MVELLLRGKPVATVFDLLGKDENDLTHALGWALAQSKRLSQAFLADIADEVGLVDPGPAEVVLLQEWESGRGITDIEVRASGMHVIVEAKRGWNMPSEAQVAMYAQRVLPGITSAIVILSEASRHHARGRYPNTLRGPEGESVPVVYRPWELMIEMTDRAARGARVNEGHLLRELIRYLKGTVFMRDLRSNLVYVVPLSAKAASWAPKTPLEIVQGLRVYFCPVGGKGGWPAEPANYLGFRYGGQLQAIHHVDDVESFGGRPSEVLDGEEWEQYDYGRPHFLYKLGPPIRPTKGVYAGKIWNTRLWARIDLLLTCDTIYEAHKRTYESGD
jgi:hypothetical protein